MNTRMTPSNRLAALVVAACLAACGSPSGPDPQGPAAEGPSAVRKGTPAPAASSTALSPAVMAVPPPQPARIAARAEPSIEECIERSIHDKEYDSMNPRDARRKLRRLQVKADCEQQLASR